MTAKVRNKNTGGVAFYDVKRVECHNINGTMQWALLDECGYVLWLPATEFTVETWEVK